MSLTRGSSSFRVCCTYCLVLWCDIDPADKLLVRMNSSLSNLPGNAREAWKPTHTCTINSKSYFYIYKYTRTRT